MLFDGLRYESSRATRLSSTAQVECSSAHVPSRTQKGSLRVRAISDRNRMTAPRADERSKWRWPRSRRCGRPSREGLIVHEPDASVCLSLGPVPTKFRQRTGPGVGGSSGLASCVPSECQGSPLTDNGGRRTAEGQVLDCCGRSAPGRPRDAEGTLQGRSLRQGAPSSQCG